jgi:hypothetical protein
LTERPVDYDCVEYCGSFEALNKRIVASGATSCDQEFQAHLRCRESNTKEACSTTVCKETADAWTACMRTYCAAVRAAGSTDPNCASSGAPTLRPL